MEFTAKQIAEFIGGRVEGDELASVNTFAKIEEGKKGAISFLSNPKYQHYIYDTESSIVLINDDVVLEKPVSATLIRVKNAYECVAKLLQLYAASMPLKLSNSTTVSPLSFFCFRLFSFLLYHKLCKWHLLFFVTHKAIYALPQNPCRKAKICLIPF